MKNSLLPVGAAMFLVLAVTGCEIDGGLTARIQEKSAVYATLKPWQKKHIDNGVVAMGFTPDMAYMAIGNPTNKETVDAPADKTEVWTYRNYYPRTLASAFRYNLSSSGSGLNDSLTASGSLRNTGTRNGAVLANSGNRSGKDVHDQVGGPQGGSMEPADLQSFTLVVTFTHGQVTRMKLDPS